MADPYTVLHGGFHKTASTFLQKTLQRNSGKLLRHDVKYVPHRDIRKQFTVPCQQNVAYEKGFRRKTLLTPEQLREMTSAFFQPILEERPRRLVLSDENLAGHCGHCVRSGNLYRYRKPFIAAFARELPIPIHEIHLSVRNYADFFSAAYIEYLRSLTGKNDQFATSQKMCWRVFQHMPGWNGVINTLTKSFPETRIVVWRFEDFVKEPKLKTQILQNLAGDDIDVSRFDPPQERHRRPSASGAAVRKLELVALTEGVRRMVELRQDIQTDFPRSEEYPVFDPWDPWERAHLLRLYDRDMARLATNRHVTLLTPDNLG